jgi:hypothetical protein
MSRTLTGRRQAETVAQITATSTWSWGAEASGCERTRRATVRRIARLTGTEPIRWDGEISDEDWTAVLSAGADALLAHAADEEGAFALDLVAAAEEITAEAATATDTVIKRTTVLPDGPASGRHVAQAAKHRDFTPYERAQIERWSRWRNSPRFVTRSGLTGKRSADD